jgi:hypothetical protein
MTYRIKEVKYNNGAQKFFPEFSVEDVSPYDESVTWYRCFGTEIYGYFTKQLALNTISTEKRFKSETKEITIHKVDDNS